LSIYRNKKAIPTGDILFPLCTHFIDFFEIMHEKDIREISAFETAFPTTK
jgi:hypothetical protein